MGSLLCIIPARCSHARESASFSYSAAQAPVQSVCHDSAGVQYTNSNHVQEIAELVAAGLEHQAQMAELQEQLQGDPFPASESRQACSEDTDGVDGNDSPAAAGVRL
jgi:uncharacterized protein YfiM (DUF2279 family)